MHSKALYRSTVGQLELPWIGYSAYAVLNGATIPGWQRDNRQRHRTPPTSPASAWRLNSSASRSGRRSFGRGWQSCRLGRQRQSEGSPVRTKVPPPQPVAGEGARCPPKRGSGFPTPRRHGGRSRKVKHPARTLLRPKRSPVRGSAVGELERVAQSAADERCPSQRAREFPTRKEHAGPSRNALGVNSTNLSTGCHRDARRQQPA